jgi:heme-degrading monooxygenase HmoA
MLFVLNLHQEVLGPQLIPSFKMITRIVKLEFEPEKIEDFIDFFEQVKHKVNSFPGCKGMQLLRDKCNGCIVFTYSIWESEAALENYRTSETFSNIWYKIKVWFAEKPEAWTLNNHFDGLELFN